MATVLRAPEQRVLLDNITWDLYEGLLVAHRDLPVVSSLVLISTFVTVFLNLLIDLTYNWLDPRITYR